MRPEVGKNELMAVNSIFRSKYLTEGKITEKFEKAVREFVNAKFAIATTSATTALHVGLESLKVKNKRVLVSDFTFPATGLAIIQAGGIPVLVDVDRYKMNVTREIIEETKIKDDSIVCPVSLFGNPLDLDFYGLKKKDFLIIEDAATNLGVKVDQKFVGELADITCFSFHPRKIITTGEGGMITTNNKKLSNEMRSFKMFGKVNNKFVNSGTNYKLSDIQSAIGLEQMKKLHKIIDKRIKKAKIYDEMISKIDYVSNQRHTEKSFHTYQSYVCIIEKNGFRNKVIKKLSENNIESQIGTYAMHCLPIFKKYKIKKLANSKFLYENTISIPLHNELKFEDQEKIIKIINSVVNE